MIVKLLQNWVTRSLASAFVALVVSTAFFVHNLRTSYESWQYQVERYEEFKQSEEQTAQACNKFKTEEKEKIETCVQKSVQKNQFNGMLPYTSRVIDCEIATRAEKEQICNRETSRFDPPGQWKDERWKFFPLFLIVFLATLVLATSFVYFFSESSVGWKRLALVVSGTSASSAGAISAYLASDSDEKLLVGLIFLVGTFPCAILAILGLRRLWRWVVIGFRADGTARHAEPHNYIDSKEPVVKGNVAREESSPTINLTVVGNEIGAQRKSSFKKWASIMAWALGGCLALVLVVLIWFLRPQLSNEAFITALGKTVVLAIFSWIVYLARKK